MRRRLVAALAATALLPATAVAAAAAEEPLQDRQWGLGQVHAPDAWAVTAGAGTVIAIVDSGVDRAHEDLAGSVLRGATFLECGDQPCGDGDWRDGPDDDGDFHGTHVAGIAGAPRNGIGIAGVAPDARLLPVRVLDETGSGTFEDVARGIRWAADQGADVINLSLGALSGLELLTGTGLFADVEDAIAHARAQGAVVVAAAGNDAWPLCSTPAFTDGALCVTATDARELPAAYSNRGLKPDLLTVAAPGGSLAPVCGEGVLSTVPEASDAGNCDETAYGEYDGTSMAAPHVAGVAALLASAGCTDTETLEVLTATSRTPLGTTGVFTPAYGYGIVDAAAAVAAAAGTCTTGAGGQQAPGDARGQGKGKPAEHPGQGKGRPEEPGDQRSATRAGWLLLDAWSRVLR